MNKVSSFMILVSCACLAAVFFVPLWYITLEAPQYPGGLDMYIWINQITGTNEFTLQNVNILNHYVGMAPIHPDSFAELKIMPYVVMGLIATGLLTAFLRNKKVLMGWTVLLLVAGTVGLADFYHWIHVFGTNLDPKAPIKIEGMTYSPPFIGVKNLLNITATSFPHWGGLAFGLAAVLAIVATVLALKKTVRQPSLQVAI